GGVVNNGDQFRFLRLCQVAGDRGPLLVVTPDGAEYDLESLLGQLGIGRRAGDHRDAGLVVDGGSGNRGAGIEVPHHTCDLGVHELLRDRCAYLRVRLVVFGNQHELRVLAVDLDFRRVRFVDREAGPILVVLAQVRDAAGERADVADLDLDRGRRRRRCSDLDFDFFLFAAADQADRNGK